MCCCVLFLSINPISIIIVHANQSGNHLVNKLHAITITTIISIVVVIVIVMIMIMIMVPQVAALVHWQPFCPCIHSFMHSTFCTLYNYPLAITITIATSTIFILSPSIVDHHRRHHG
jgi:type II secretory pathway component PulF